MITYTFKIKTTPNLIQKIESHLGSTRLIYNLAKEVKEYAYSKGVKLSKFDLIKQLPELKEEFVWLKDVHSQTLQGVVERLYKGYDKFFSDLKKGIKTNKPKWAKKGKWCSVEFKKSAVKQIEDSFEISKIGKIRVFKSREIDGNIKLARIVKKGDGYYFQVVTDYIKPKCNNQAEVGVDMGIKYLLVTSDGDYVENIKTTEKFEKQLRIENRSLARKKKFSRGFYKQVKRVSKLHLKIKRIREDYLHKVSTNLANNYQYIYIEDLSVKEMLQNKNLSKQISDASWSKLTWYLEYKSNTLKVNPAYTSQECNKCGHISKDNRKTQSHFKCRECFYENNADLNACLNVLKRGQSLSRANVNQ